MYSSDPVKEESSLQKSRSLLALLKHIIQQICKHSDSRRIALYLLYVHMNAFPIFTIFIE